MDFPQVIDAFLSSNRRVATAHAARAEGGRLFSHDKTIAIKRQRIEVLNPRHQGSMSRAKEHVLKLISHLDERSVTYRLIDKVKAPNCNKCGGRHLSSGDGAKWCQINQRFNEATVWATRIRWSGRVQERAPERDSYVLSCSVDRYWDDLRRAFKRPPLLVKLFPVQGSFPPYKRSSYNLVFENLIGIFREWGPLRIYRYAEAEEDVAPNWLWVEHSVRAVLELPHITPQEKATLIPVCHRDPEFCDAVSACADAGPDYIRQFTKNYLKEHARV